MSPEKNYFFCRLVPPRPTFPLDMDEKERKAMEAHAAHWRGLFERGQVVVYGPVMDPRGAFGMGVIEAADQAAAEKLLAGDPVLSAGIGMRLELCPMRVGGIRR